MIRTKPVKARTPLALALAATGLLVLGTPGLAARPAGASGAAIDPADAEKEAARLVLATVDGEPITLSDLQEGFGARHMGHGSLLAGRSILRGVLDKAIDERLLIQEGYRMGIDREPGTLEAVDAYRDVQRLEAMEQKEFHDAAEPTKAEIDEVYAKLKIQRRLFLIETPSKEKAEEARRRLDAGEEFDEVAREVSTHHSRIRGGDLGWVTWGRLAPDVEEAVEQAKTGQTVGPISSEGVQSIVRIAEIREGDPPELARVADRLRELLRQRKRTAIFRDFIAAIRKEHPPVENAEALAALSSEAGPAGGGEPALPDEAVLMRTETGLELTAGKVRERASQSGIPLAEAFQKAAVDTLLIDEARRRIEPDEEMSRRIQAFLNDVVRRKVQRLAMDAMPEIPQKEVRAHYERESASFRTPDSYHLRHILVATEAEAEEIRKLLDGGGDFAELARTRSIDAESAPSGGDLGWVDAPADASETGAAKGILGMEPGEISGVISMPQGFAIVQLIEKREGHLPPFEKVKLKVAQDLVSGKQKEVMDRFLDRLREHAEITRDEKALDRGVLLLDAIAKKKLTPAAAGGKPERHP